ncbi:MAG: SMC-Scp complex subunit ScpB [Bacilli bacterium]|nr:SMC-Scp complex subunit ScpB [Bacilli bacterium]MDD3895503.1 SMC-Scp complex subunit ScpB [Bacilli bacterium]MDD4407557.1 SMC-Scp complex subunit ScpB [Bacilli bacterium]
MKLLGILEGILFVVGDEGITLKTLCETMKINEEQAKNLLSELKKAYEEEDRGLRVTFLGDAFKLTTKKEHKEYFKTLVDNPETNTLSPAALETLAIIAYNEPVTRLEVDQIRGVNTTYLIRKLAAKGLIKEEGKSPLPGKPNLYVTTKEFLDYFGLATKKDLPKFENNIDLEEDVELFTSIYKEDKI